MSRSPVGPYVIGQWVRGERFYGRRAQIAAVLGGSRQRLWLVGTRRVGKTSLLRQLELLAAERSAGLFPLVWDLEGSDRPEELDSSFADALLDAEERLGRLDLDAAELARGGVVDALDRLVQRLAPRRLRLLLLCDEGEELIRLGRHHPELLHRLDRALADADAFRWVLASSLRLRDLAGADAGTARLLASFQPPVFVARLTGDEARALACQEQLPAGIRPHLPEGVAEAVATRCGGHPYLVQLLCRRHLEVDDLDRACASLAGDRMLDHLFSVDLALLAKDERAVLRAAARQPHATVPALAATAGLGVERAGEIVRLLEEVGMLEARGEGRCAPANVFLAEWLVRS